MRPADDGLVPAPVDVEGVQLDRAALAFDLPRNQPRGTVEGEDGAASLVVGWA